MNKLQSIITVLAMSTASLSSAAVAKDESADLTVKFAGIEVIEGTVMGAVFDNEMAYDGKGPPIRQIMVKADKPAIEALLTGLAPGVYAIKIFHDIDLDLKISTNPYGVPIEPFAFSNNAIGNMGPAKWADAKFEVKQGKNIHTITIN